jgi:hypothetical protein
MTILEAIPGALIRGERKSMARRVRDIYSKLKMTYDYPCLVRQARRSPNSEGQTPRQCKSTKLPWHANTDPCAPPWTSFFERDQQSTCRRNSRDVARQTAPGIHLPHTLLYCPTHQHRYVVPRPAHCSHGSLVHNATIDHRSPSGGSGT